MFLAQELLAVAQDSLFQGDQAGNVPEVQVIISELTTVKALSVSNLCGVGGTQTHGVPLVRKTGAKEHKAHI